MSKKKGSKGCNCGLCVYPNWMKREDHIREVGKFLGYPKCCIEAMINDNDKFYGATRLKASMYKGSWTGFIPCQKHAERIINEGKNIARLIRNRLSNAPFPSDAGRKEFERYLKTIKKHYIQKEKNLI